MINSLISASIEQQDTTYLERIPKILLTDLERKAVNFIIAYQRKYHKTPTAERFEDTDHAIFLTKHLVTSPLKDLYEQTVQGKQGDYLMERFHELEAEMDQGETLDVGRIVAIGRDLSAINMEEDDSLFSVDRDEIYSDEQPDRLTFGYETLDTNTGGIQRGEYGLLVARTGVGKTLVTVALALKWAREGKSVLFISCEMPTKQIIGRIDAMIGQFNPRILRNRDNPALLKMSRKKVDKELKAIKMGGGDIIFPKSRSISLSGLRGIIADRKPDAVIVDGVYLLRNDDNTSASSDWQRLKAASNELKQICLEEDIPVFATSQLKRTGKEDGFNLEDIAYSDALAQDTDLVLVANKFSGVSNQLTIEIIKNRHGDGYGGTMLKIDWDQMTLTEAAWTDEEITIGSAKKKRKSKLDEAIDAEQPGDDEDDFEDPWGDDDSKDS